MPMYTANVGTGFGFLPQPTPIPTPVPSMSDLITAGQYCKSGIAALTKLKTQNNSYYAECVEIEAIKSNVDNFKNN